MPHCCLAGTRCSDTPPRCAPHNPALQMHLRALLQLPRPHVFPCLRQRTRTAALRRGSRTGRHRARCPIAAPMPTGATALSHLRAVEHAAHCFLLCLFVGEFAAAAATAIAAVDDEAEEVGPRPQAEGALVPVLVMTTTAPPPAETGMSRSRAASALPLLRILATAVAHKNLPGCLRGCRVAVRARDRFDRGGTSRAVPVEL
jgi:hypothetical protein